MGVSGASSLGKCLDIVFVITISRFLVTGTGFRKTVETGLDPLAIVQGSLNRLRRQRERGRHQTKDLTSRIIALR